MRGLVEGACHAGICRCPGGELGQLCRRLRQAAGDADRCLSVSRRGDLAGDARREAEALAAGIAVAASLPGAAGGLPAASPTG